MNTKAESTTDVALFLTPDELAKRWRITAQTLANWRCKKKDGPKFLTLGGRIRYPAPSIEEWEKAHTTE